ncbi:MAG: hypothetical protein RR821_14765, partial [Clostridia bacterium]
MNEGLFTAYAKLPIWQELLAKINDASCTALYEVAQGERPFMAAAIAYKTGRPVVLISPSELIAQKQAQDVERLTGSDCAILPARDIQFSRAAMSRESTWQRLRVLDALALGKTHVLCMSIDSLLDRCVPKERFQAAALSLTQGERFAPEKLMTALLNSGYERVPMVEGRGQCAMRGSILD